MCPVFVFDSLSLSETGPARLYVYIIPVEELFVLHQLVCFVFVVVVVYFVFGFFYKGVS